MPSMKKDNKKVMSDIGDSMEKIGWKLTSKSRELYQATISDVLKKVFLPLWDKTRIPLVQNMMNILGLQITHDIKKDKKENI
jgi:hypothetical protein